METKMFDGVENKNVIFTWLVIVPFFFLGANTIMWVMIRVAHVNVNALYAIITEFVTDFILFVMLLLVYRSYLLMEIKKILGIGTKRVIGWIAFGLGMSYGLLVPISLIAALIFTFLHMDVQTISISNQSAVAAYMKEYSIPVKICAVIFAPVIEELLFRTLIFYSLRKYNKNVALWVSTVAFGLCHILFTQGMANLMSTLFAFSVYAVLGFALGLLYKKSNNILLCIITHFAKNLISVLGA